MTREQARLIGGDDPQTPGLFWLRKRFGDFDTALAAAKREAERAR